MRAFQLEADRRVRVGRLAPLVSECHGRIKLWLVCRQCHLACSRIRSQSILQYRRGCHTSSTPLSLFPPSFPVPSRDYSTPRQGTGMNPGFLCRSRFGTLGCQAVIGKLALPSYQEKACRFLACCLFWRDATLGKDGSVLPAGIQMNSPAMKERLLAFWQIPKLASLTLAVVFLGNPYKIHHDSQSSGSETSTAESDACPLT